VCFNRGTSTARSITANYSIFTLYGSLQNKSIRNYKNICAELEERRAGTEAPVEDAPLSEE
jgi:hypothetical protein